MTTTEMVRHVTTLARSRAVTIKTATRNGRAWRRKRQIAIPPIKSVKTYALALHELGHVLSDGQRGRRLDKEVDAWRWAKATAREWTPEMSAFAARCLGTYVAWAERKQKADKRGRVFITDNHPVYAWISQEAR